MKVRLLNWVALAAIAMGSSAFAQQDDALDRALADLNNGMVAPLAGNVTANGSTSLNISGEARVRNTWFNPARGVGDHKNIDTRLHLNFAFDVTEQASAFIQFNAAENFGNPGFGPNVATLEPVTLNTGTVNQAYFTATDLVGDGGEFKVGRSFYTLGSGRILGTDDFDQIPSSYSGIWYTNPLEGWNLEVFMITDVFNAGGVNGAFAGAFPAGVVRPGQGDADLYGLTFDYVTDAIPLVGTVNIQPYVLRYAVNGSATGDTMWYGAQISGEVEDPGVTYNFEGVFVDSDRNKAPRNSDFNAWSGTVGVDLGNFTGNLPGNVSPILEGGFTQSDKRGITINPVYHDEAGIGDWIARTSGVQRAGVFSGFAGTQWVAIGLEPVEGWDAHTTFINFVDKTGTGMFDATEVDVTLGHTFDAGHALSLGIGWVQPDLGILSDQVVIFATMSLPF